MLHRRFHYIDSFTDCMCVCGGGGGGCTGLHKINTHSDNQTCL